MLGPDTILKFSDNYVLNLYLLLVSETPSEEPNFGFDQGQKYGQGMRRMKQHEPAFPGEPK